MVMAQSLFKALRENHPDTEIDVLAPAWSRPLLERMPEVREAIDMPLGHGQLAVGERWRLGRGLRGRGYGQAIVLPNSLKSALVPFWAGIPRRTGYVGELRWGLLNDARRLDKRVLPMTVQRFVALVWPKDTDLPPPIPTPHLEVDPANARRALTELGMCPPRGPLLALCPGAEYGPAKRWPAAYYAELARSMRDRGWDVWLFGSEKDQPVCAEIVAAAEESVDLSGRTSLAQALDLMSLADAVVSNDSGLMHVAAALGKRLVAIYGSSDPGFTPPLNPEAKVLSLGLECSPCFKRECPLGHLKCLRDLGVERVVAALDELAAP